MQSVYHFNPIEEFKATAAISRLTRSHVINDHPGYDPSVAMGTITLNIQHNLSPNESNSSYPEENTGGNASGVVLGSQSSTTTTSSSEAGSASSSPLSQKTKGECGINEIDEKSVANTVAQDLVEQKATELELSKKNWNGLTGYFEDVEDDGTTHKFVNITFTETVICQSCNKKVEKDYYFLS